MADLLKKGHDGLVYILATYRGPWTNSRNSSMAWEFVGNAEPQAPPQTSRIRTYI